MWKSKFYGAFVLNHRVVLHAIDATPARWCGDAGSSPLDRARSAAPDTLVDFHTGDDEGRKVAVGLLLGDARDRSAFPRITRAVEKASPDARYRLHRAALAGCRLQNDESRAAQLQLQIHAEGLEALRPAATVRGRMVPFENDRAPSKELDALCELLGDRYEPHLRALPYAFEGDAAAGARSLKYHAEKKALAHLLADDAAELRVDVNFKMCADCHGFFKAASAVVDRPIHVSEGGRPAHTFRRGQCSCGDACSLGVWKSKLYARVTTDWSIFIQVALGGAAAARRRPHGGGARLARRRVRARRGAHDRARVAAPPPARGGRAPTDGGCARLARRGLFARRAADGHTNAGRRRPRPPGSPGLISDCMKLAPRRRRRRRHGGVARRSVRRWSPRNPGGQARRSRPSSQRPRREPSPP